MQRTKWIYLSEDVIQINRPILFDNLKEIAMMLCNYESNIKNSNLAFSERLKMALKSRTHLNNAVFYLKSLLDPSKNIHILDHKDAYKAMNENLGRIEKRLDEHEKELISIERTKDYNLFGANDKGSLQIERYIGEMNEIYENIVFTPIRRAVDKFLLSDKTKIIKDRELFLYYIFVNILLVSDIMGSWTREEQKQTNISNYTNPPEIPETARYEIVEEKTPIQEIDVEELLFTGEESNVIY